MHLLLGGLHLCGYCAKRIGEQMESMTTGEYAVTFILMVALFYVWLWIQDINK